MNFPYEIRDVIPQNCDDLDESEKLVKVGPDGVVLPALYKKYAHEYYNFELRDDDIIIIGLPRSGTTMTQELIWLLVNNLNFHEAKVQHPLLKVPYLEGYLIMPEQPRDTLPRTITEQLVLDSFNNLQKNKARRILKTHLDLKLLPPDLLAKNRKIIYVARNPKDLMVSYFHFLKGFHSNSFSQDFSTFFEYFINDMMYFTPYWSHINEAWKHRNNSNFKFIFYEDFIADLKGHIRDTAKFLEKNLSPDEVDKIADFLNFDNFKCHVNDMVKYQEERSGNKFVRNGKTGGWREYFSDAMNEKANQWIGENLRKIRNEIDDFPVINE